MLFDELAARIDRDASCSQCTMPIADSQSDVRRLVAWPLGSASRHQRVAVSHAVVRADLRSQLRRPCSASRSPSRSLHDPVVAASRSTSSSRAASCRSLHDGQLLPTPFLDLRGAISTGGERGLLGMAFAPDARSGRVFFNFTNLNGAHRGRAVSARSAAIAARADPASRFDLRWPNGDRFIRQPFANHNGGHLAFGPDGYLYIGLGDGGSGNDPQNNAQNPSTLLGKMLRIDVNVGDGDPTGYRVPPTTRFVDGQPIAALGEIWAFGLRNPWRYSFDDLGAGRDRRAVHRRRRAERARGDQLRAGGRGRTQLRLADSRGPHRHAGRAADDAGVRAADRPHASTTTRSTGRRSPAATSIAAARSAPPIAAATSSPTS